MRPATIQKRVANAVKRRGKTITLRRITTSAAPYSLPNPPTMVSPVLDGAHTAGDTTIAIRGSDVRGRLIAGDELKIGATSYTVTGTINSRSLAAATPGFDAVTISPGLVSNLPDGTAIVPKWLADEELIATIRSYPIRLIDGSLIQARDLWISIGFVDGLERPTETDKLLIDGDIRAIVSSTPAYAGSVIARWDIQAR